MKPEILCVDASTLNHPSLQNTYPKVEKLFYVGNPALLGERIVAVVGMRAASSYGLSAAYRFAKELSDRGISVISGLARGVDGAAHRGALAGCTPTIAVLAHGLHQIYPPEHRNLAREILEKGGLLLSEYPEGVGPQKVYFPLRNRIIAALSESTIVVEARQKSGSLITAQCALELGKEVYVVPGRYDDAGFLGGHSLIQEGARLLKEVGDVIGGVEMCKRGDESPLRKYFLENGGILTLEELFAGTRFSLPELYQMLEDLIVSKTVLELFPQQYSWIKNGNERVS